MHEYASCCRFNIFYDKQTFPAMSHMVPVRDPTPSMWFGGVVNYNRKLWLFRGRIIVWHTSNLACGGEGLVGCTEVLSLESLWSTDMIKHASSC